MDARESPEGEGYPPIMGFLVVLGEIEFIYIKKWELILNP